MRARLAGAGLAEVVDPPALLSLLPAITPKKERGNLP